MAEKILTNEEKKDEVLTPVDEQFKTAQSYIAGTGTLGGSATKTDILYYSTTSVSTYSTTAGQVLAETIIPGGTLGKASAIEFEVLIDELKLSGSNASGTFRITFTLVINDVLTVCPYISLDGPSGINLTAKGKFKGTLIADGDTKQKAFLMTELGNPRVLSTVTNSGVPICTNGAVVATVDAGISNSSPIRLRVMATNSHNAADHGVKTFLAVIKKLV